MKRYEMLVVCCVNKCWCCAFPLHCSPNSIALLLGLSRVDVEGKEKRKGEGEGESAVGYEVEMLHIHKKEGSNPSGRVHLTDALTSSHRPHPSVRPTVLLDING